MQYKILANKWRPRNLNDIIGQDHAVFIIKNIILEKNIHHSYIISGPQGTGKTTLARIITKCLNCEINITVLPCNICYCCQSIDVNQNSDSIEIDAASKTKVEDIKDIIDLSKYKNTNNRYKTYIIDECHMLSQNSFNYLLKILEEPIENTIYILVTTQLEKIPHTIISRCIDIQLKKVSNKDIKTRLTHILEKEQIKYDNTSLDYISLFSNGSIRQAINTIEKIINFKEHIITIKDTKNILGIMPDLTILFIIKSIYENDTRNLIKKLKCLTKKNTDYKNLLTQMQVVLYKILLYKTKVNYDKELSKHNIFIYLSQKLEKNDIVNLYFAILKNQTEYTIITDLDFEIILISLTLIIPRS